MSAGRPGTRFTREDLSRVAILDGLPDEHLDWFCEHGERISLDTGQHMFERGDPADAMWIVVEGAIQGFEEIGGQWLLAATTPSGQVTGMLPFSRMTHYPRYTIAAEPSVLLKVPASLFPDLLHVSHEMGRRLVARMSDRVRGNVRLEQQSEKMMSLGRLSAGLAHELNNPATAVRRAAATLLEHRVRLPGLVTALVRHHVGDDGLQSLEGLRARGRERQAGPGTSMADNIRESELLDWLESRDVDDAWDLAPTLNDAGITIPDLEDLASHVPDEALGDGLAWLGGGIESDRLVAEIAEAAGRISELVASIKTYSHMDRSAEHKPTDVRAGIDNTLTMLGHKLKAKAIRLSREYQPDLPLIPANAGELNQVWTNLIDNAIDAVDEGGNVTVRARRNDQYVEVQIVDDGHGIPEKILPNIFDPFFTTKEVGVGTGLGLGIAQQIVQTHMGHIEVRSRPGETVMCVRLPAPEASHDWK